MKDFYLTNELFKVEAVPVTTGVWGLKLVYQENSSVTPAPEEWIGVLKRAVLELESEGAQEVQLRIERSRFSDVIESLPVLGFRLKHERSEFHAFVSELPDDSGSPITWKPMEEMESAAAALHAVGVGDPDYDPSEDALEGIKYFLGDTRFKASALQLGMIDRKLAGLVIVQVKPDGWSRITYMGVHPDFRRRGLGKWVHRKGFSLMKAMGGTDYFGGTVSTNQNMLRLFRENNCKEIRVLQEWTKK